jgi:hypothetical protein
LPLFSSAAIASVYDMRSNGDVTNARARAMQSLSMRSAKKLQVVARSFEQRREDVLEERFREVRVGGRSANAISGSTIQNSARWRLVLLFSARNVGPNV